MFLMRTISSCFSSSMTLRFLVASRSVPPRTSASMRATRRGVARMPGRRTSSPTPSRMRLTPFSIFLVSIVVLPSPRAPLVFLLETADGVMGQLLEGHSGLAGRLDEVVVFGLDVDGPAAQGGDLQADLLPVDADALEGAVEDAAADREIAHADGRRFLEDGFDERVQAGRFDEDRKLGAQPVLLHDDGGESGVEGALLEGPLEEMGQELGRGVVDGGLDDVNALAGVERSGVAVIDPQDVRDLGEFLGAGAAA